MRERTLNAAWLPTACLFLLACITGSSAVQAQNVEVKRWAILIGVDDYIHASKLKYCVADMLALKQQLVLSGFDERRIFLLRDKAEDSKYLPFKSNIETQIKLILKLTGPNDVVLLAFSGHGAQFGKNSCFCPTDARLDDAASLVSLTDIYERLEAVPAALRLVIVDACRNNPHRDGGKDLGDVTDANQQFSRGMATPPPVGILDFTSCSAGEKSWEEPTLKHGVFMHYLLEGLKGRADKDRNGQISLNERAGHAANETELFVARRFAVTQIASLDGAAPIKALNFHLATVGLQKLTNSIGMTLVPIPAGEFLMGAPDSDRDAGEEEKPQHKVRLTRGFLMGQTEVTQAEYQRVMNVNPSYFSQTGDCKDRVIGLNTQKFPVDNVSWYDAIEFCNRLSALENLTPYYRIANVKREDGRNNRIANVKREDGRITSAEVTILGGNGYRLPTEAEWEYACRARTPTRFHFGDSSNGRESNVDGNYPVGTDSKGPYLNRTTTVGSYPANAWELFDMHGDMFEWCQDGYDNDVYQSRTGVTPDPFVWQIERAHRVLRGGPWYSSATDSRSSCRSFGALDYRDSSTGFRVSRTP